MLKQFRMTIHFKELLPDRSADGMGPQAMARRKILFVGQVLYF